MLREHACGQTLLLRPLTAFRISDCHLNLPLGSVAKTALGTCVFAEVSYGDPSASGCMWRGLPYNPSSPKLRLEMAAFFEVVWRPEVGTVCDQMETPPRQADLSLRRQACRDRPSAHNPPQDALGLQ